MLDRQQRDELIASLQSIKLLWEEATSIGVVQKNIIIEILRVAGDVCRKGLSAARYVFYKELFQVLKKIMVPMVWQNLSVEAQEESRSLILKVINCIVDNMKIETEIKKEIVFLPYKASMWDSLESVWKKAYEDKAHCNVYVVPIPYYDRKSDLSFGEFHWEGNEFPKTVPIVDYHNIDLYKFHPDVIYIHNPYDSSNYVTSIAPEYYSKNLRQCTEQLVYIPYSVEDDINANVETYKNMIITDGVINAHRVIVQSERMRQIYIETLCNHFGEKYRKRFSEKIFGTGSPKIDKVKSITKEDVFIPDDWMKHIKKADGSWKKIVMYNNSVGTLVRNSEKVIKKYRWVLDVFKKNCDEICLLWRPHPLIKATIQSMHPELWTQYSELVDEYKAENWGIYDDSADLNRAIALSDAYYGDCSSVVTLMQAVNKRCMIQNLDVLNEYM